MSDLERADVLYSHGKRKEWGFAILAWDHSDKRGYQFEDGKLRVFKEGYWDLLAPREAVTDEELELVGALRRRMGWRAQPVDAKKRKPVEGIPFERQVKLFLEDYAKGFQDAVWAKDKRGIDTTRRLQRHRDVVLVEARKRLCPSNLGPLLEKGEHRAIIEEMLAVGNMTDLIPKAKLKPLEDLSDDDARLISRQLNDLLHGEDSPSIRFERFVDALGKTTKKRPTWELATVFRALYFPKEHLCVKTSVLRTQAATLGRALKTPPMPSAPAYERMLSLVVGVERLLEEQDQSPRDLFDVIDFMATTISPKAMKRLQTPRTLSTPGGDSDEKAAA